MPRRALVIYLTVIALVSCTSRQQEDAEEQSDPGASLVEAARAGDAERVRALLEQGVELNGTDAWGPRALWGASMAGDATTITLLLEAGVDVNPPHDGLAQTPLMLAIMHGHSDFALQMLAMGANVHITDRYNETPLMTAAYMGNVDVARELLARGVDVNARGGRENGAALGYAAAGGHDELVSLLLEAGADASLRDGNDMTPAAQAQANGFPELEAKLRGLESAVPAVADTDALLAAVRDGDALAVRRIVAQGIDLNARAVREDEFEVRDSPLTAAVRSEHLAMVRLLLELGAAAATTAYVGEFQVVTPLGLAVERGNTAIAAALLERGADVNVPHAFGTTVLMQACSSGPAELCGLILDHEPALNATSDVPGAYGRTALMWAVEAGNLEGVRRLVEAGADVNVMSGEGVTAMQLAEVGARAEIISLLGSVGAHK